MNLGNKVLTIILIQLLICLIAPIGLSIGMIPVTLQTFILFLIPLIFGKSIGLISGVLYLIIGALGAPVFGAYTSGIEKLIGPTAGFLLAFPLVSWYIGWAGEKKEPNFFFHMIILFRAHLLLLIPGFIVLYYSLEGVKIWETFVRLLPGLLIKTIVGGVLSAYILNHLPKKASEFLSSLKNTA